MTGTMLMRTNTIWMAFDNGYTTNYVGCNPVASAPMQATRGYRRDCGIARSQTRTDGSYRFLDADGAKEDPITPSRWRAFRAGERVGVDFDN